MRFNSYVKSNQLNVHYDFHEDLSRFLLENPQITELSVHGCENVNFNPLFECETLKNITHLDLASTNFNEDLSRFLLKNPQITELNLDRCENVNFNSLFESGALKNITHLDLTSTYFTDKECKKLAKLIRLTHLNLTFNEITDVKELCELTNLIHLNLCGNKITDVKELYKLTNLTYLNLHGNEITDEMSITKISKFHNSTKITLPLRGNENSPFFFKCIKYLAECGKNIYIQRDNYNTLYSLIKQAWSENNGNSKLDDSITKKLFFDLAQENVAEQEIFQCLLDDEKYPFLINSTDDQGRTLSHFYNHDPKMQEFFFERGMIPEHERNSEMQHILNDNQSVHDSRVTQRTNFLTKKLVESTENNKEELKKAANSFCEDALKLSKTYIEGSIRLALLDLPPNEKRDVMKNVLLKKAATPSDGEFIKEISDGEFIKKISDKAIETTKETYLRKKENGEYDGGHTIARMQYDFQDDNAKISIPESIGRIKLLIDKYNIPLEEKKELLVTLIVQNPQLVKSKLSSIKAKFKDFDERKTNRSDIYNLLKDVDDQKVNELFKEISDLEIDEIWREQKLFILIKQLYIAATTYGENSSACIQGTWTQIIDSLSEISTQTLKKYDRHCEMKLKEEENRKNITEENIKPFTEELAEYLIEYIQGKPELENELADFAIANVYINKPGEITFEQQKILEEINKYFGENIKNFLPNYDRNIPTIEEYILIINGLAEVGIMQNFANRSYNSSVSNNNSEQIEDTVEDKPDVIDQNENISLNLDFSQPAKEIKCKAEEDNSKWSPEFDKAMWASIISMPITAVCVGAAIGLIGVQTVPSIVIVGMIIGIILGTPAIIGIITHAVSKHQWNKEPEEQLSPGKMNELNMQNDQVENIKMNY